MASTYTTRLKLERQGSGENSGNWGNLVNFILNRIDSSVRGYKAVSVAGSANVTLVSNTSTTNTAEAADDQVHNKVIEFTGALTGAIHVFTDAVEGEYIIHNNTSGAHVLTFANTGHAANGVAVIQGTKSLMYTDGSTITDVMADLGNINVNAIGKTGSSNYFTLPGTDGSNGQALVTNGSKVLSFASAGITTGKAIAMAMIFG